MPCWQPFSGYLLCALCLSQSARCVCSLSSFFSFPLLCVLYLFTSITKLSVISKCVCVCFQVCVKEKKKEWNDLFTSGFIFSVHSVHRDLASMAVYRLSVCMCSYIFSLYSRVLLKDPSTLTAHWSFNTRWPPVPPQYNTHSRKHVKQCQICESGKLLIAARLPLSARLLWMEVHNAKRLETLGFDFYIHHQYLTTKKCNRVKKKIRLLSLSQNILNLILTWS